VTCAAFLDFLNQKLLAKLVLTATSSESIDLLETKNKSPDLLSKVSLSELGHFVAINHDAVDGLDVREIIPVKDLFKKCDAIILGEKDNQPYILVIDLKSTVLKVDNHRKKMKAGKLFIDMFNLFLSEYKDNFGYYENISNWEKHYIILHCNVQKSTTGNLIPDSPNTYINPRYIYSSNDSVIKLKVLQGKRELLLA
jgi:hypothetical protein